VLSGTCILDLADETASFCSRVLADLGARVIKIEKPGGDHARNMGPFFVDSHQRRKSLSFLYNNTNKQGITLNFEHAEAHEIFLQLVRKADIVIETFPPGYLKQIELSYDKLRGVNPKLILASVTGFGQKGPKSNYRSCDLVASASGGQMYVSGSESTEPLKAFGQPSYYTSSLFAAVGILLALQKRKRDGLGSHLDLSLQESVVATLEHVMIRYFSDGSIPVRQGNRHWDNTFYIFPCKDGFIHMTPFHHWDTLFEWIDSEGMASDLKDPKWKDPQLRNEHFDHIVEILTRWTKTHTVKELFEMGQLMRFPWGPVQSPLEVTTSPQLRARDFFKPIMDSEGDAVMECPGSPYKLDPSFPPRLSSAPEAGQDNRDIYQKELGIPEEELKRLTALGAI
jgi:crotonobetainyl-CoA:carnitine CoA-transferase CaiB-like acyl-CoA transferase